MSLRCDSTNRAMIVSVSDRGDPAKISFKMLSTDSLEMRPDSFCTGSTLGRICVGDCAAVSINAPFPCSSKKEDDDPPPGACITLCAAGGDDEQLASPRNHIRVRSEQTQQVGNTHLDAPHVFADAGFIADLQPGSEFPFHSD